MKMDDFKKPLSHLDTILFVAIVLFFIGVFVYLFIQWTEERDKEIMQIDYCFQERADGSLYHYVCEK